MIVTVSFIILVQGWSVFSGGFDKIGFVSNYSKLELLLPPFSQTGRLLSPWFFYQVEIPVFLVMYLAWRLIKKVKSPSLLEIDLDTGRYVETARDVQDNKEIEEKERGKWGWFWKAYSWIA